MTPAASRLTIDEQNPWPGLSAFDEAAQRFFNGRREESAALRRLVLQAPLTVLFAASGLGKTSLVQAGLFPLLRKDTLPVYVRLDPREREAALIDQAKAALQAEIRKRRADAPEFRGAESLWEYLHGAGLEFWSEDNRLLTPLFVFDQFEEVFTLGAANAAAITRLRTDLADLIENRMPASLEARVRDNESAAAGLSLDNQRYKVLLSFREDFLASIEGWKRDIPSIMRNRLRLLPMSAEQALEAVNKTAPHLAPEPIARRIVAFVAAAGEDGGESSVDLEVAPALLSLVCHGLNERRKEQGKATFDEALLTGTGQAIVTNFYRSAVAGLPESVQRFIERELITERGFRKPCDVDDAHTVHGVAGKDLALLVDRRVLRIEPVRGAERVELTHDLLTRVVREERDRRRERERRRRRLMLAGATLAVIAAVMAGLYVGVNRQKNLALAEKERVDAQLTQARKDKELLENNLALEKRADAATRTALNATQEKEREKREALSHQLAGAAVNAQGSATGILFALNSLAVTRDVDHTVLPDSEEALRQAVDAVHRAAAASGTELKRPGYTLKPESVEFSPDGSRAVALTEGTIVWDTAQQEEILRLPDYCAIREFSRDGKRLACGFAPSGTLLTGPGGLLIPFGDFLDLDTGKKLIPRIGSFSRGRGGVTPARAFDLRQMGFSPDGTLMLWGSPEETNLTDGGSFSRQFPGHGAVFSPDGKALATIGEKAVKLWDVRSGNELRTWQGDAGRVVFSGDGRRLAVAALRSGRVFLWDLSSDNSALLYETASPAGCLALNQDGTRLAVGTAEPGKAEQLAIVDTSRPALPLQTGNVEMLGECQFASDGKSITWQTKFARYLWNLGAGQPSVIRRTSFTSSSVKIEDLRSGTTTTLLAQDTQKLQAVAYSPDATRLVTSGSDGRARVWDTASGSRLLTLVGHQQAIFTAAYSPDGTRIATAGLGPVTKLWDAHTGRFLRDLNSRLDRILAVAFSPDSGRVVTAGNGSVIVWNAANGTDLTTGAAPAGGLDGFGAAFSPDGKRFALFGSQASIRDAASFSEILRVPGNLESVGGAAISRDGQFLTVAQPDGVHLWRQGSAWKLLPGSAGGQRSAQITLAFSRDGKRLVTPGAANTVRVFDTATAQESATLYCENRDVKIKGVAFSPDEEQIYGTGDNWTLYRFAVPLADLKAEARKLAIEAKVSLTDEDCGKYLHQRPCPQQLRRIP